MKKNLLLLFFMIFTTCCVAQSLTYEQYLQQINNFGFSLSLTERNKVIELCKKALQQNPKGVEALKEIGQQLYKTGNYSSAIQYLSKLISIDNNNIEALYFRGLCFTAQKNYKKAVPDLKMAVNLSPKSGNDISDYYYNLGKANYMLNSTGAETTEALKHAYDFSSYNFSGEMKNKIIDNFPKAAAIIFPNEHIPTENEKQAALAEEKAYYAKLEKNNNVVKTEQSSITKNESKKVQKTVYQPPIKKISLFNKSILYTDSSRYVGDIKNKKREGYGILTYSNGNTHEGNWKNNLREGLGTFIDVSKGEKMEANWINDKIEGKVTITYTNEEAVMEGDYTNDELTKFTLRFNDAANFVGKVTNEGIEGRLLNLKGGDNMTISKANINDLFFIWKRHNANYAANQKWRNSQPIITAKNNSSNTITNKNKKTNEVECSVCKGTGYTLINCSICKGTGKTQRGNITTYKTERRWVSKNSYDAQGRLISTGGYENVSVPVTINGREETCGSCHGNGYKTSKNTCVVCKGKKTVIE